MVTATWKRIDVLDDRGSVISSELVLLSTFCLFALLIGLTSFRDAVMSELSDTAGAFQDLNQCFAFSGTVGHSSSTHGSDWSDALDFCDDAEDASGQIDNCITFDGPSDESPGYVLSDVGSFDFDTLNRGRGGSASGTIGDAAIRTGFEVTTDTGYVTRVSNANALTFYESDSYSGRFTVTYDDPLTEYEFWVRSLANIAGSPQNLLGNFSITLSDGSVYDNAAFQILPDVIKPYSTYGEFATGGGDASPLVSVTVGGLQYLTDPAFNGGSYQGSGRVVFPDIPVLSNPLGRSPVGVQSISFDRIGGPNRYQAVFSSSGRVIQEATP